MEVVICYQKDSYVKKIGETLCDFYNNGKKTA